MLVVSGVVVWASRGGDKLPAYSTVMTGAFIVGFASWASIFVSFFTTYAQDVSVNFQ
jgi:hypothetical protein